MCELHSPKHYSNATRTGSAVTLNFLTHLNVPGKDKQKEIREGAVIKSQKKAMEKEEEKVLRIHQERKYTLETTMKVIMILLTDSTETRCFRS